MSQALKQRFSRGEPVITVNVGGANPDAMDIRAFTKTLIADFKVPQYITFRKDPLPRNAGGKDAAA